jgi:hypothetical protein
MVRQQARLAGRSGLLHGGLSRARPSRAPPGKPLHGGTMGGLGPSIWIVRLTHDGDLDCEPLEGFPLASNAKTISSTSFLRRWVRHWLQWQG